MDDSRGTAAVTEPTISVADPGWGALLEGLHDPHVLLAPVHDEGGTIVDLRCVAANGPACAGFPGGRAALVGAGWSVLLAGDVASALFGRGVAVLTTGVPLALDDVEIAVRTDEPDPPTRRLDIRAVRLADGLVVSWRDVTDRWQERQALAASRAAQADSEHRYRVIAELSSDFVYEIGPDMRIRWASPSIEALTGWSANEMVGRLPMDLFPPDGHDESQGMVARALAGETVAGRRRLQRRDGTRRWFYRTARPILATDGAVTGVVAGFRDIEAEVQSESALAASEERYRLIADNASDIVYLAAPDGTIQWVSPSVKERLGWSPEELLGRRTDEFVHPLERPGMLASAGAVNAGESVPIEFRLTHKDGTHRWYAGASRPLLDATGSIIARTGSMHDITERHEANEALVQSEQRFRNTVDEMLDPLVILQPVRTSDGAIEDFTYAYVNPAACAFYGRDSKDLLGRRIGELFPALVEEGWIGIYARIVETGAPFRADGLLVPGGEGPGDERYTDKRAYRLGSDLVTTWRDVTTQRRAEAALREAETRYRLLLDSAADIVVLADAEAVITWVSPSVRTILGWEPDALPGRNVLDLVHPEDRAAWHDRRAEIDTVGTASYEARYERADGSHCWMSVATTVVRDEAGEIVARTGILRDVSAEHAARAALERSREELAEAQRVAHVGSWSIDLETGTVQWSAELFRIAGLEPGAVAPDLALQRTMHPPDTLAQIEEGIRDARDHARAFEVAGVLLRAGDGAERHVITRGEPVFASDGRVVRVRGSAADVTELRAAELRIRELNEGLELRVRERTAELETFTYTLSHDLRAPLRWINGFAAMLQRRDGERLDETSRHYLDEIRNASDRMGRLFEELLDYSRLGRQTVRSESVDWGQVTAALRGTFGPRIASTGATLAIVEPLTPVRGDPMLLDRALANLVDNALTYARPGEPADVTVRAVARGSHVRVSVSDRGIGIPADQQERVFQPFVRLHDADTYPGTGIGLAIVHRAVGLMGSEVHVDSIVGEGTTFWFELAAAD